MANIDLSDDECCEKLLNDSEKCSPDEDVEEDCIQLLLTALEKDGAEFEANKNKIDGKRTLSAEDSGSDTQLKLYLKRKYGNLTDNLEESVNGSVSELNISLLKLNNPAYNVSSSGAGNATCKGTVHAAKLHRQQLAMKLLQKHNSETGKIVCGIFITLILLGIGGSLLFLAYMMEMEDLYILGGIFSVGGVGFTIAFIVVRCQACEQMEDTDYSVLYKT